MDAVGASVGPEPASLHSGGLKLMSSGREVIPALGPSWSCCVNLRIFLSRLTAADMQYVPQVLPCATENMTHPSFMLDSLPALSLGKQCALSEGRRQGASVLSNC